MAGVWITKRYRKRGTRYNVRYRLGGAAWPLIDAGTFKTWQEAKERQKFLLLEIASGRNPAIALEALKKPPAAVRTFAEWAESYVASRIDAAQSTQNTIAYAVRRLIVTFGERDPATIAISDVQQWVAAHPHLSWATLNAYRSSLRAILDFAGVDPNPARDHRVKLPRRVRRQPEPPTADEFIAMLAATTSERRLPLVVLEQTGLRPSELIALTWSDLDESGPRLRVSEAASKTGRARWVDIAPWLLEELHAARNGSDFERLMRELMAVYHVTDGREPGGRVFPGLTRPQLTAETTAACRRAGIRHCRLYLLRHRRISLWGLNGMPPREVSERAGHSLTSTTFDIYSHMLLDTREVDEATVRLLLRL
jgi:integrase